MVSLLICPAVICAVLVILFSKINDVGDKLGLGLIGLLGLATTYYLIELYRATGWDRLGFAIFAYVIGIGFASALFAFIVNKKWYKVCGVLCVIDIIGIAACYMSIGGQQMVTWVFLALLCTMLMSTATTLLLNRFFAKGFRKQK